VVYGGGEMTSSLVISNFKTGYETDREPFIINNDAFPILNNAYQWRGKLLRKRGTQLLGRLQRNLSNQTTVNLNGSGNIAFNLLTTLGIIAISPNASIVPGTLSIFVAVGAGYTFADTNSDGRLITTGANWDNAITAVFLGVTTTLTVGAGHFFVIGDGVYISGVTGTTILNGYSTVTAINATQIAVNIDTTGQPAYTGGGRVQRVAGSVNYATGAIVLITNRGAFAGQALVVSFGYYPALPVMGLEDLETDIINFPILVPFDTKYSYQFNQTTNIFYDTTFYKNTFIPFVWHGSDFQQFWTTSYSGAMWTTNNVTGFQFKNITLVVPGAASVFTIVAHGLTNLDYVFINEVGGITGVNGVSGLVTVLTANTFSIPTPGAAGVYTAATGIAQYMTSQASPGVDGIKWYDGDPTDVGHAKGWVNFSPPLSNAGLTGGKPEYLIGARMIVAFKNRLLFFGVTTQTSGGVTRFLPNRLVYSQVGTPFYSLPVPAQQVADDAAYFENVAGRGGFITAPTQQFMITAFENNDVILVAFESRQMKLLFTGDDSLPFIYQTINTELGAQSTFTGISLDTGVLSIGDYGITLTTPESTQRVDLQIPDTVFSISPANSGDERVTAVRDFRNEFIYYTYCAGGNTAKFPNQSLVYNYRDATWAIFQENYTSYGTFRRSSNFTWATLPYRTWASWSTPWNFGVTDQRYPDIIGGNQHGFVMRKDTTSCREDYSQMITDISGNIVTSPDHGLLSGDFIMINEIVSSPSMVLWNGVIQKITVTGANTFTVELTSTGTYGGGGVYRRIPNFLIQTKQFPLFWDNGRKCRIGTQRFLLTTTTDGQMQCNIYTSQNANVANNDPLISGYLAFTNVLLTKAEPNDLNMAAPEQSQIWHRMSNSFQGDSVQIGFTFSEVQLRDDTIATSDITIHAIAFDLHPGPILC
jgi:hypothetical protein